MTPRKVGSCADSSFLRRAREEARWSCWARRGGAAEKWKKGAAAAALLEVRRKGAVQLQLWSACAGTDAGLARSGPGPALDSDAPARRISSG